MPNPIFDALGITESPLYDDLMRESIYNHGIGAKFLPRTHINEDDLLGRTDGAFHTALDIDVVITDTNNLDTQSEVFESYGITIEKTISFNVHKSTFLSINSNNAPEVGDLVYLPYWDLLLEINAVDTMNVLELGAAFVYSFSTTLYKNHGDEFSTGVAGIDDTATDYLADMAVSDDTAINSRFSSLVEFSEDNPFSQNF